MGPTQPRALNLTMSAIFVCFSFIRPKPSRLFLHPSLLPQHNSKMDMSCRTPGLLCPNKATAHLPNLALLQQRLRVPPSSFPLLVVTSVLRSSENYWDVWFSSSLAVLSLAFTNTLSLQKSSYPLQKSSQSS